MKKQRKTAMRTIFLIVYIILCLAVDQGAAVLAETGMKENSSAADIDAVGARVPLNPVHHCTKKNDGSDSTDWSYVYFGSYPQSEVKGSALKTAIVEASYDENGDTWVNGIKYRRISKNGINRYFKWERIKWRVLKNNGSTLFVAADRGLDCKDYHDPGGNVTWEFSTIRVWLNEDFYRTAFSKNEQNAIVPQTIGNEDNPQYGTEGGNNTRDKIYQLSIGEITNPNYGFCSDYSTQSMSRRAAVSDYAHVRGGYKADNGNGFWWLRSPGFYAGAVAEADFNGYIYRDGGDADIPNRICVPVLNIDLASDCWLQTDDGTSGEGGIVPSVPTISSPVSQNVKPGTDTTFRVTASGGNPKSYTYQWYYASSQTGTGVKITGAISSSYTIVSDHVTSQLSGRYYYCVVSNGIYEVPSDRAKLTVTDNGQVTPPDTPANPVHHCTQEDDGSDRTDWSYVYFGSYPQSEVTGGELTTAVTEASYDEHGDAWVNGTKYRRIDKNKTNSNQFFGDNEFRYFKWERIKWKVLKNNGSTLFLMADQGLDCKDYHDPGGNVTWESSTIRTWLNDEFYRTAFGSNERNAIIRQEVCNEDNPQYKTEGGNPTNDNIYLLSVEEITDQEYGFCENYHTMSMSRGTKASDYAHARGAATNTSDAGYVGNCWWWLRSPGKNTDFASKINTRGHLSVDGNYVSAYDDGCVPALHINLSSDLWLQTDDNTSGSGGIDPMIPNVSSPESQNVKAGTGVTFQVTASGGNPSTYSYQWYYAASQTGAGIIINGATESSYSISADQMTTALNGRYYYCIVSNGIYDVISERANLTVQSGDSSTEIYQPPTVSGLLEWYTAAVGASLDLSVTAGGGNPDTYTYQWYYALSESGPGTIITGADSSKYTIPASEMTLSMNGRYYYCMVSNGMYHVESKRTRVFVYKETDSDTGENGTSLLIQVIQASSYTKEYGSKPFYIQAFTNGNGTLTYQSSNRKVAEVSSGGQVNLKGYGTSIITIRASKTSTYQAAVKQITIQVIPKKTALKKVRSSESRKISLKWKKNKKAGGYEIYVSSSKKFKSHTIRRTYPKSKTNTILSGLKSGKKYYVKIRSYAKVGKKKYYSVWSKIKQVKVK